MDVDVAPAATVGSALPVIPSQPGAPAARVVRHDETLLAELRGSALLFAMALAATAGAVGVTQLAVSALS